MPDRTCIVVGAGPAGLAAALELRAMGCSVELFEKSNTLKGKVAGYCCKATEQCSRCGVCHVDHHAEAVLRDPRITLHLNTEITEVSREPGGFSVASGGRRVSADFLVWSGGFRVFDAALKRPFGYGRLPNVITGFELEQMLYRDDIPRRPSDGEIPRRIAFIQCVGSRDIQLGAPYCSQVCCAYAVRMARLVKHGDPSIDITIYYMDLQSPLREFDAYIEASRGTVEFIRGLPGEILSDDSHNLLLRFEENTADKLREAAYGMVVLSVGIRPEVLPDAVIRTLGFSVNEYGFLRTPETSSGAVAVGTATGPMNIMDAMTHARSRVRELVSASGDSE